MIKYYFNRIKYIKSLRYLATKLQYVEKKTDSTIKIFKNHNLELEILTQFTKN